MTARPTERRIKFKCQRGIRSHLRLRRTRRERRVQVIKFINVESSADLSGVVGIDVSHFAHIWFALSEELWS